jgi:hypothetical protein
MMQPSEIYDAPKSSSESVTSKFHLELDLSSKQIHDLEIEACAAAAAVAAVCFVRSGKAISLIEKAAPVVEETSNTFYASLLRSVGAPIKTNFYALNSGFEATLSRDAVMFGKRTDVISITHPVLGEAHLLKDGSRLVNQFGAGGFYDEARVGIHSGFPGEPSSMLFSNRGVSDNGQLYKRFENCFLTGSQKTVQRLIDKQAFQKAVRF